MLSELHQEIARAVSVGTDLDVIEEAIIDRAPLDEEHKSALWLYAEALRERPRQRTPIQGPFAVLQR